jgi:hypothetical protein
MRIKKGAGRGKVDKRIRGEDLTYYIMRLRDYYVESGHFNTYKDINQGKNKDFVEDVIAALVKDGFDPVEVETLSNDDFIVTGDWFGEDEAKWDRNKIEEEWNNHLPEGKTWFQIDHTHFPYHTWIFFENHHYDAEHPYGVDNFFELESFRRQIKLTTIKSVESRLSVEEIISFFKNFFMVYGDLLEARSEGMDFDRKWFNRLEVFTQNMLLVEVDYHGFWLSFKKEKDECILTIEFLMFTSKEERSNMERMIDLFAQGL